MENKKEEHVPTWHSVYVVDYIQCSCGWKSATYYDGREFALEDHKKHVEKVSNDRK